MNICNCNFVETLQNIQAGSDSARNEFKKIERKIFLMKNNFDAKRLNLPPKKSMNKKNAAIRQLNKSS